MQVNHINELKPDQLAVELKRCCGSRKWLDLMLASRPYASVDHLLAMSDLAAASLDESDWREAFTHHPQIGDIDSLREKFATTGTWAAGEQSGVNGAADSVLQSLAADNRLYKDRFGYIFIVCASGKSAQEMLAILQSRLGNEPAQEILIAAAEQNKITRIRLEKLCQEAP